MNTEYLLFLDTLKTNDNINISNLTTRAFRHAAEEFKEEIKA